MTDICERCKAERRLYDAKILVRGGVCKIVHLRLCSDCLREAED